MRLYRLIVDGRANYVGTQADARAAKRDSGAAWAEVEVPTDKAGLIGYLNANAVRIVPATIPPPAPAEPAAVPATPTMLASAVALDAGSILARMDNPHANIDAIVESIARMKGGYALRRIAGAVAIRFEELSR